MAHGIEVRVPLDRRIIDFCSLISPELEFHIIVLSIY